MHIRNGHSLHTHEKGKRKSEHGGYNKIMFKIDTRNNERWEPVPP